MTRLPTEVDREASVSRAGTMMRNANIRHLPVMDGPRLFGVVSSRDIDLVSATAKDHGDLRVGDICSREPLVASPVDSVAEVARRMLERRVGSAVIIDAGLVVGIFTVTDALEVIVNSYP